MMKRNAFLALVLGVFCLSPAAPAGLTRLTTVDGGKEKPIFSPDGNWLVYKANESGKSIKSLHSIRTNGTGSATQLNPPRDAGISNLTSGVEFKVTSDSSRVIYQAQLTTDVPMGAYSVAIDGGPSTRLIPEDSTMSYMPGDLHVWYGSFQLNSAGTQVASVARPTWTEGQMPAFEGTVGELIVHSADGTGAPLRLSDAAIINNPHTRGVPGDWYNFTPDGNRVLYRVWDRTSHGTSFEDYLELWSRPSDGGGAPVKLAGPEQFDSEYSTAIGDFETTNTRAVYRTHSKLYSIPVAGGASKQLNGSGSLRTTEYSPFRISPDGETVAYISNDRMSGKYEVFARVIDGSEGAVRISGNMAGSVRSNSPLTFTHEGDRVLYMNTYKVGSLSTYDFFSAAIEGDDVRNLSEEIRQELQLADNQAPSSLQFLHDDEDLFFTVNEGGSTTQLWVKPFDGSGPPIKLTPDGVDVKDYEISPDGRFVSYDCGTSLPGWPYYDPDLFFVSMEGGVPFKILDPDGHEVGDGATLLGVRPFTFSPDGTQVAFFGTDGGVEGLYLADIPEPATMTLLAFGGLALLRRRRKKAA